MRNFKFNLSGFSTSAGHESVYRISRRSTSYEYLKAEFRDYTIDYNGDILIPDSCVICEEKKVVKNLLSNIRKKLTNKSGSFIVPCTSDAHLFFVDEYRNSYTRDHNNNIIVPAEFSKKKVR